MPLLDICEKTNKVNINKARISTIARLIPYIITQKLIWAFVWITRQCEQMCDHCYVYDNTKPHMDYKLYTRIIDNLEKLGIAFISIFGGNPALHPDLLNMICYAHSKKLRVFLNIDLTSISSELLQQIIELNTDVVSFSLDTIAPSQKNKRGSRNLDKKINLLLDLTTRKNTTACHCNVTISKANINEVKEVVEYLCKKERIGVTIKPASYPFLTSKVLEKARRLLLDDKDLDSITHIINWVIDKKKKGAPIINPYSYLDNFSNYISGDYEWNCNAYEDIISVDTDGTIIQCSYFVEGSSEQLKNMPYEIEDVTSSDITQLRYIAKENQKHCTNRCYSPAYYCTNYYKKHLLELMQYYLM